MRDDLMIEAGVSLECRDCGQRTLVPASKVEPGVKCRSCGAELVIDTAARLLWLSFFSRILPRSLEKSNSNDFHLPMICV